MQKRSESADELWRCVDVFEVDMAEDKWKVLIYTCILGCKDVNGCDALEGAEKIGRYRWDVKVNAGSSAWNAFCGK